MPVSSTLPLISPPPLPPKLTWADRLWAFWKFARPHTIIGTSLSVLALWVIAQRDVTGAALVQVFAALVACLAGNLYIVGLNQLEDIAIDRINKPHLPLAAGEFSPRQGQWLVAIAGVLALGVAAWQGPYLLATVALSLAIGTAYSLPPIRLKRFPFWASLCILTVRGVVVNLGLFLHFQGGPPIPPPIVALTLFVLVFSIAIALFKDIPDLAGDLAYQIATLTVQLGQQRVFQLSQLVLTLAYGGMVLAGALGLPGVNRPVLITTHVLAWLSFIGRSQRIDWDQPRSISQCYQFIWKLFFLEYVMFPVAVLLHRT